MRRRRRRKQQWGDENKEEEEELEKDVKVGFEQAVSLAGHKKTNQTQNKEVEEEVEEEEEDSLLTLFIDYIKPLNTNTQLHFQGLLDTRPIL